MSRTGRDDGGGPRRGGPQVIPRPSLWTPGNPAPWESIDELGGLLVPEHVRRVWPSDRRGVASPVAELGAAASAVLVPIYPEGDDLHVVLTRRSRQLRTHRGEVSFPGGRADPGESHVQTAVREAYEEVALDPGLVEPLGELDHLTTITRRTYIAPVVGLLPERPELRANPAEVDAVLHVPFRELMRPDVFREERWGAGDAARPVYFFELEGDTVWGATAALLRQLLARLTGTDPGSLTDLDPARGFEPEHFELDEHGLGGVV